MVDSASWTAMDTKSRKLPAFMFYTGDWLKKTRRLSLCAKGAWIELIVAMWDTPERGVIVDDLDGYARLLGCSKEQTKAAIDEISAREVCDREDLPDGRIKLICRRMVKEQKERENGRDRQNKFRNKPERGEDEHPPDALSRESNGDVTALSHASSYSSSYSISDSSDDGGVGRRSEIESAFIRRLFEEVKWLVAAQINPKKRERLIGLMTEIGEQEAREILESAPSKCTKSGIDVWLAWSISTISNRIAERSIVKKKASISAIQKPRPSPNRVSA